VSALGTQTSEPKHRRRPDPDRASVPRDTEVLVTLKADAERAGYRTQRAYLEALIAQGLVPEEGREPDEQTQSLAAAYPSSAWALGPTILANRIVLAIEASYFCEFDGRTLRVMTTLDEWVIAVSWTDQSSRYQRRLIVSNRRLRTANSALSG
jgi:hypothetical protein